MKVKMFLGKSVFVLILSAIVVLAGCHTGTDPINPDGSGPVDYPFNGTVFENETLPIFNYDILLMNGNADYSDPNLNIIDLADSSYENDGRGTVIMMDFSKSKNTDGDYVWNGVTLSLDQLAFNPIDLSAYDAMTFKLMMIDNGVVAQADGNGDIWDRTIEKVGFGLGSEYETYANNKITVSAYDTWENFIIPIPDSTKMTSTSNLLFFTDSALHPSTVYIDDIKFISKSDIALHGMGGNGTHTYDDGNWGHYAAKSVDTGATLDLNDGNPYWINFTDSDAAGTWGNENAADGTVAVNGSLAGFFSWTSNNTAVAKVNEYGIVTGVAPGTAEIKATFMGDDINFNVTVSDPVAVSTAAAVADGFEGADEAAMGVIFGTWSGNGGTIYWAGLPKNSDGGGAPLGHNDSDGTMQASVDISAGYAGLNLELTAERDWSTYTGIELWVLGSATNTGTVELIVKNASDAEIINGATNAATAIITTTSTSWTQIQIPFGAVDMSSVKFVQVKLDGFVGDIWFDDITAY